MVVATVELRMQGHDLSATSSTKVFVDLQRYTDELINNTLPPECDDCNFVISFGGASITNGAHTIGVSFFDGEEKEIASDAVDLVFAR